MNDFLTELSLSLLRDLMSPASIYSENSSIFKQEYSRRLEIKILSLQVLILATKIEQIGTPTTA